MKRIYLLFLLFPFIATAQLTDKQLKEMHDNTAKIDSMTKALNESINANMHVTDSLNMVRFNEQNARNLDAFMAQRKVQEQKAMRNMYWRLGFGVLMLIVLIVGLKRKKKVKSQA